MAQPDHTAGDPASCHGCKLPPLSSEWQYQLQGHLDLSQPASVYDIDGLDAHADLVSRLHATGRYAICYVDVGTWESWRADHARFPGSVLGRRNGWPGERWLDIRRMAVLEPIIRARMRTCRRKGFDAVEPDNVDGYAHPTGFAITYKDQLRYNRLVAEVAHRTSLAVALKNDLDQIAALLPYFDFAVAEQCFEFAECQKLLPFVRARKSVFDVEYRLPRSSFCRGARRLHINALRQRPRLNAAGTPCRRRTQSN